MRAKVFKEYTTIFVGNIKDNVSATIRWYDCFKDFYETRVCHCIDASMQMIIKHFGPATA